VISSPQQWFEAIREMCWIAGLPRLWQLLLGHAKEVSDGRFRHVIMGLLASPPAGGRISPDSVLEADMAKQAFTDAWDALFGVDER
jgi:hypothetical protein